MTAATRRSVPCIISGYELDSLARDDTRTVAWAEMWCRNILGVPPGANGLDVDWAAFTEASEHVTESTPTRGQPCGPLQRHTWYPGTPLPPRTSHVVCTVTATATR